MAVAPWIVSDELWELVEPLLPKRERRFRYPGRKRLPDRQALQGILFVLHTGIAWTHLPQELGFGSGVTCWRRLDEWQRAGVWERLHAQLLARLRSAGEIEWSRAVVDSSQIQAKKGAPKRVPSPVDRGRPGSKQHLLVDASGIPLAWGLTGSNRNDIEQLLPLVEAVPAVAGRVGRPRRRPESVVGDRGYDSDRHRQELRERGITPLIARRQSGHGSGLGRVRWVVERTFAHLHNLKRLLVRDERRADMHTAFLALGCCLI
jgi:transposase